LTRDGWFRLTSYVLRLTSYTKHMSSTEDDLSPANPGPPAAEVGGKGSLGVGSHPMPRPTDRPWHMPCSLPCRSRSPNSPGSGEVAMEDRDTVFTRTIQSRRESRLTNDDSRRMNRSVDRSPTRHRSEATPKTERSKPRSEAHAPSRSKKSSSTRKSTQISERSPVDREEPSISKERSAGQRVRGDR
jgi:hypothetical protein